jgi:hypothetical protein
MNLAFVFAVLFCWNFGASADYDFWWHIKAGEYIAQTGSIPHLDQWTYTMAGLPWIAHEWLAELAMYALFSSFGFWAVTAFYSLISTVAFGLLYLLFRRLGAGGGLALLLMLWARAMLPAPNAPRPLHFTMLFMAIFVYVLYRYKAEHRGPLWLLPILSVFWVNLHAGYVAGLMLLGCVTVGEWLNGRTLRPSAKALPLLITTVLSALVVLINPNGLNAVLYPLSKAGGNASMQFLTEWQSADFHQWWTWPFAALLIALLLLGARRIDFTQLAVLFVFAALALQSWRHVAVFAIVATPFLVQRFKEHALIRPWNPSKASPYFTVVGTVGPVVVAVLLLSLPFFRAGFNADHPGQAFIPRGAVSYLKEHKPAGNLFNAYNWGGYLIQNLPEYPVFIDGRGDPFPDQVVNDFHTAYYVERGWRDVLDRWDISILLVEKTSRLAVVLENDPAWWLAYQGPGEQLYLKNTPNRSSD